MGDGGGDWGGEEGKGGGKAGGGEGGLCWVVEVGGEKGVEGWGG